MSFGAALVACLASAGGGVIPSDRYDDHTGGPRLGEAAAEIPSAGFSGSRVPERPQEIPCGREAIG